MCGCNDNEKFVPHDATIQILWIELKGYTNCNCMCGYNENEDCFIVELMEVKGLKGQIIGEREMGTAMPFLLLSS